MIEEFLFIVLFLTMPIVWMGLLRFSGVRILIISIPSVLLASIFLNQYIGFPTLFFHLDDYRSQFIQDHAIIWEIFFWNSFTITMILFGFIAARKKYGPLNLQNQFNSFHKLISFSPFRERLFLYALLAASITVLVIYVANVKIENLAILNALGFLDHDNSSKVLRSAMGNAFEGKYHWYRLFMRDFLSIASYGLFANWLMRRKRIPFLVFLASFIIAAFSMLMATEKGPFLYYLISLLFIYIIIKKKSCLSQWLVLVCTPLCFCLIGVVYIFFMGSPNIWQGILSGFSRMTTGQISGLYHYLEIFPYQVNYLLGSSFPNPGRIFPWEPYRLTVEVMHLVHPELESRGIVGSMPTFFWGEMYANFGYLGIIIPPFFTGFVVYAFNIVFFRLPVTPLTLSFFVWTLMYVSKISGTGLSGYIINPMGLIMTSFMLLAFGIAGRGLIGFRRTQKTVYIRSNLDKSLLSKI